MSASASPTDYLYRWNLTPDGAEIVTSSARLFPVSRNGAPAMLKIMNAVSDEADAPRALKHFAGRGGRRAGGG